MSEREPKFLRPPGSAAPDDDQEAPAPAARPAATVPESGPTASRRSRTAAPTFYAAGFWRRLAAAIIDAAIVLPVAALLAFVAGRASGVRLPPSRHRGPDGWLDLVLASDPAVWGSLGLIAAIAATYLLVFQATAGRTPGMRLLGVRVIDVYGDRPTVLRAAARTLGYLVAMATLSLGFLWIAFDAEKRGLHDWVSGTYVVKA